MQFQTINLSGSYLNYAVAIAQGYSDVFFDHDGTVMSKDPDDMVAYDVHRAISDGNFIFKIVYDMRISLRVEQKWIASAQLADRCDIIAFGSTPQEAIIRLYCLVKIGESIEIISVR